MSGESATRLRAKYSTASAKSVEKFVAKRYALPGPVECALLHRGFNDSFEVKAADGQRYVLRLSCRRPRGEADVASETAFLTYLDSADVPVAAPLQTRDGARFAYGLLPEGRRPVVLFRYAEGAAPRPWASDHAKAQGITLARIHNAADAYRNRDDCAFRLDLNHLLNRQVHSTLTVAGLTTETQTNLTELASRLSASVSANDDLSWTRCHGDCHGGNARILEVGARAGQAVFFDFDDGGPGYLAYDLAVYLWACTFFGAKRHAMWLAFVDGYSSIRSITQEDFDSAHVFAAIRHIWLMGEYAGRVGEWGSLAVPAAWVTEQVEVLKTWERSKLFRGLF